MVRLPEISILLEDLLPQSLVADNDTYRAWLIKKIKVFVRDKEFNRVVARYLALRFYRDGIADGVEGDGKGDDDKRRHSIRRHAMPHCMESCWRMRGKDFNIYILLFCD